MDYITTKQAGIKWGISERRVRILCEQGKIDGVIKIGKSYSIPEYAKKPSDSRFKPLSLDELYKRVDERLNELNSHRPLTKGELERLNEDFMIEYTYNSNAIEGNTLTLRETALVLRGITIDKKPIKEHLEAIQHRDAFYFVCDLVTKKTTLTEAVIKEIHSLILNDRPADRGIYRDTAIRIASALVPPANPIKIPVLMKKLVQNYTQSTEHTIKRIAQFHNQFEHIHPFIDGNGRTGRLIANLELMKAGYPPIDIKFADRKTYYDCFRDFDETDNTDRMERLFAGYVLERIEEYLRCFT